MWDIRLRLILEGWNPFGGSGNVGLGWFKKCSCLSAPQLDDLFEDLDDGSGGYGRIVRQETYLWGNKL